MVSFLVQDKVPALLVGERVASLNASYHQAPSMPLQSVNEKTDENRKNLVMLFGKEIYMKLYEYATKNLKDAKIPTKEELADFVKPMLPASADPIAVYKEMEIIVFRAQLGNEGTVVFGVAD